MNTLRIAKIGKNVLTSTTPSDFIFNPDYNTPSIIKEDTHAPTLAVAASETFTNKAHGLNYTPFTTGFVKFANNRVGLIGSKASGVDFFSTNLRVNDTNIRFGYVNNSGGDYSPTFKYLATEIPLAGTPSIVQESGRRLIIAKSGFNALTETNPNNLVYDSRWGTLKYFLEGITEITIPGSTPGANVLVENETVLATHNLDYYPFYGANFEYSADDPGKAYIMPLMFADAGFETYDMIYATTTQLIYKRETRNSFGGIPYAEQTIKVYWKIYSRDLGL